MSRGGRTRFQLRMGNRTAEALTFSMHAYDFDINENGMPFASVEETEWSCADWITFTPQTFELQGDGTQIVEGLVRAPKDAQGAYYAFITSDFRTPTKPLSFGEGDESQIQLQLGRAVSSVLMVTLRSSKNYVQLEPDTLILTSGQSASFDVALDPAVQGSANVWEVTLLVANTGNVHTVARGDVSIWTEDMRVVERAKLLAGKGYVLPGKSRLFNAQGTKALDDGIYMVKVSIRTREGKFVQGSFPYSIIHGKSIPGAASEAIRALVQASMPRFSISERLIDFKVSPKSTRTRGIRLANHLSDTLSIYAKVVSWSISDSGKVVLNPDESDVVKPCVSWISVSPSPILLPPKRSGTAKVRVTAPEQLDGEYYAAVIFQTSNSEPALPTELLLGRTALVTVSSSRNLEYRADIESVTYQLISPMLRGFVVNVANNGNVHCFVSGKLELYDRQWNLVMEPITFGGTRHYILPQRVRGYFVACPGALEPGRYEAVVKVEYHEEAAPLISKVYFESKGK